MMCIGSVMAQSQIECITSIQSYPTAACNLSHCSGRVEPRAHLKPTLTSCKAQAEAWNPGPKRHVVPRNFGFKHVPGERPVSLLIHLPLQASRATQPGSSIPLFSPFTTCHLIIQPLLHPPTTLEPWPLSLDPYPPCQRRIFDQGSEDHCEAIFCDATCSNVTFVHFLLDWYGMVAPVNVHTDQDAVRCFIEPSFVCSSQATSAMANCPPGIYFLDLLLAMVAIVGR
ncbi:unnamed protein product [Fusarium venenatum]|uniref:Uncharacterized protein n=1 Tax=Fusarium venenatum TaxID=56646 RepID=A0A2L2TN11_9HYPO|nr:uncharacterized protein FVRRES_03553 [Fusarium venenatum]CEI67041.1 unnamed protein product [Fusarium venenatum]